QALIWIHLTGVVGVSSDLPSAQVNSLQSGLYLLDSLIAGECTQGREVWLVVQQGPQTLGAQPGEGVLHLNGSPQLNDLLARVRALGALPAWIRMPLAGHFCGS